MSELKRKAIESCQKLGISKAEAEALWIERHEKLKAIEENTEALDKLTYNNVVGSLAKRKKILEAGNYEEFETLLFAESRVTDYGAKKKYDKLVEDYKQGDDVKRSKLINEGQIKIIDGKIVPIDQNQYNKGNPLNPEANKTKSIYGLTKVDGKPLLTIINLPSEQVNAAVDKGWVVKYLGKRNSKSTDSVLVINLNRSSSPVFNKVSEEKNIKEIVEKVFIDDFITPDKFKEWCEENAASNKLVFVKGLLTGGESATELFISTTAEMDDDTIHCWATKPNTFIDGAEGLVIGDVYGKDGDYTLNAVAVEVPEKYLIGNIGSVGNHTDEESTSEDEAKEVETSKYQKGWS